MLAIQHIIPSAFISSNWKWLCICSGVLWHDWCLVGCWRASWRVSGSMSGIKQLSWDPTWYWTNCYFVIPRTYYVTTVAKREHLAFTGFTTNVLFVVLTIPGWSRPTQPVASHKISAGIPLFLLNIFFFFICVNIHVGATSTSVL